LQIGSGGTDGTLGAGAVTNSGVLAINRSNAIPLGNNITGAGAFQQNGTGVTTLTGTNSYNGTTTVDAGTLFLNGNTTTTTGLYNIANAANSRGILQIGAGTSLTNTSNVAMKIGVGSGAVGVVTQNGGTVALGTAANNYNFAIGAGDGGTTNSLNVNYNFGAYNLNGGTAFGTQIEIGDSGGTGLVTITDGTMGNSTGARHLILGRFGNSVGVVTLMGTGSANPTLLGASSTLGIGMGWTDVSNNNRSELNIGNRGFVNASASLASNGLVWRAGTATTGNIGIANLLTGGTLQAGFVGLISGPTTSIFNFNGGTLRSTQTSTTFMTSLTSAYVYGGGAIIDTNGFNDTVQALLAPTGNGVSALTVSGSGYLTAPSPSSLAAGRASARPYSPPIPAAR
jgi:fibronectin-binding autotransporter adhesin